MQGLPQVNEAGLALIKAYEGFRAEAYLCPAGVWTIGYGHTDGAGPPPVTRGMRITRARAEEVLKADVAVFSTGVARLIRVKLTANQFSALVSFAYNVGLGAFSSSSVLKAVNAQDFAAVPRRLALWVKAGSRTLPGLVKRRASEGQLFMRAQGAVALFDDVMALPTEHERRDMDEARSLIEPVTGKGLSASKTVWGAITSGASTVGALAISLKEDIQKAMWNVQDWYWIIPEQHWGKLMLGAVAVAALMWIVHERWKKSEDDGV